MILLYDGVGVNSVSVREYYYEIYRVFCLDGAVRCLGERVRCVSACCPASKTDKDFLLCWDTKRCDFDSGGSEINGNEWNILQLFKLITAYATPYAMYNEIL